LARKKKRKGNRVLGPRYCKDRGRWQVVRIKVERVEGDGETCLVDDPKYYYFDKRKEAIAFRRELAAANPDSPGPLVVDVLDSYELFQRDEKENRPRSVTVTSSRLRMFFQDVLHKPVHAITADLVEGRVAERKAAEKDRRERRHLKMKKKGRRCGISQEGVDTTAGELRVVKTFVRWLADKKRKLLEAGEAMEICNVRVEGKRNAGKVKLRIDESRRYWKTGLKMAKDMPGNHGPIVALLPLGCGIDGGEIFNRKVRDLDDGGRILWIEGGKTENRDQPVEVPEELRPLLLQLAEGRKPADLLFPSAEEKPHHNNYGADWVCNVCNEAKVPVVCPHGLRGTLATLATDLGVAQREVARALRHGDDGETARRHYIERGAGRAASAKAGMKVIRGGRLDEKKAG